MSADPTAERVADVSPRLSASSSTSAPSTARSSQATQPQQLLEKGPKDTVVLHSPYGQSRNALYGWGSLFKPRPPSAVIEDFPGIHIGVSSLNGVPTLGKADRSMRSLLTLYRKKFNCLEHCYPYHKVSDAATWQSWAEMVRDSNTVPASAFAADSVAPSSSASLGSDGEASGHRVNAGRFLYTIKANNLLTHVKQLQVQDGEVQEHVHTFFHQRCPLLEPFLGPVLVQLPPSFGYSQTNMERLQGLYNELTKEELVLLEWTAASGSSAAHAASVRRRRQRRLRIAVEFRNRTWYRQETFDLLRSFRWALVVAHHHDDPTFSSVVDTGAGFLYMRLHGPLGRSVGDYGPLAMKLWAEEIVEYYLGKRRTHAGGGEAVRREGTEDGPQEEREVFVFLNNSDSHVGGTTSSTVDATCLAEHLREQLRAAAGGRHTPAAAAPSAVVDGTCDVGEQDRARVAEPTEMGPGRVADACDAPPTKRPRTSMQSGESRDDEVIID